jgi:hypothetical protein
MSAARAVRREPLRTISFPDDNFLVFSARFSSRHPGRGYDGVEAASLVAAERTDLMID